jgi:hypothetical protein
MQRRTQLWIGLACAALGACASAQPAHLAINRTDCAGVSSSAPIEALYAPGNIKRIESIQRQQFLTRAIQPTYTAGVRLYVPAEPGMHPAYVERALSCHAAGGGATHPNDPLRARGVRDVDVAASGPLLRISIEGTDRTAGKAIWQRAQALHQQGTSVEVQQLSAATDTPAKL